MANPAQEAASATADALQKIEIPKLNSLKSEQLGAAAAEYAKAVLKIDAAQREIDKIITEKMAREARLAVLQALLDEADQDPIDVWCTNYKTNLEPGMAVKTMEVPGWWLDEPAPRTSVLFRGTNRETTVAWLERSINIAPGGGGWPQHGELHFGEGLSDAAMIWNLAMEPGHLKWRPLWRYGILTSVAGGNVILNPRDARPEQDDLGKMSINAVESLSGVPIIYPPCNGRVFQDGDEVLVLFRGQDRNAPAVIGFRREPRECPRTWRQIQ